MGPVGRNRMEIPDLSVVDQAFGVFADLYSDILRVSVAATHEQIQLAYFDRRSELFTLLAKLDSEKHPTEISTKERLVAERKMDAVVLAVRVLGDSDTRLWYDRQRQERLMNRRRAAHGQLPGHSPVKSRAGGSSLDSVAPEEEHHDRSSRRKKSRSELLKQPQPHPKKSKKKGTKSPKEGTAQSSSDKKQTEQQHQQHQQESSPIGGMRSKDTVDTEHMTEDDDSGRRGTRTATRPTTKSTTHKHNAAAQEKEQRQDQEDDEGESLGTDGTSFVPSRSEKDEKKNDMLSVITNSRILRNISEELSGACEDAMVSVDQVFNAFTLTDKDITAVLKRIDRAKKQFDH